MSTSPARDRAPLTQPSKASKAIPTVIAAHILGASGNLVRDCESALLVIIFLRTVGTDHGDTAQRFDRIVLQRSPGF